MSHAEAFFDSIARFYDSIYDDDEAEARGIQGKTGFYVERARAADGPVLEVGCGTGAVYLELLRNGIDADGIDVSREMLERLRRTAADESLDPRVSHADVRTFSPEREYALVTIPGRGFLHNLTREDQQRALRRIRRALVPGGELACNFLTPDLATISSVLGETERRSFEHRGDEYVYVTRDELEDGVAQVVRGDRVVEDADGDVVAEASFRIKLVSREEFALLLETTGFSEWDVYGGFGLDPLTSADQEMVWIAEA